MPVLDIRHEEWSNFNFPEALQVKLQFECLPGNENQVYELDYMEKGLSNIRNVKFSGKLDEIAWRSNSVMAKARVMK